MANVLKRFTSEFEAIRNDSEYGFGLAQRFVATLLALPPRDRFALEPLFRTIEQDAFERGINVPNLDVAMLSREKLEWEAKPSKPTSTPISPAIDNFNEVLFHIFVKYEGIFSKMKGPFIFKMGNVDSSPTKAIFLCDDGCMKHPEIQSFDENDERYEIGMMPLNDFIEQLEKEFDVKNRNYLAVLLITPNLQNGERTIPEIKKLRENFDEIQFILPKVRPIENTDNYELRNFEEGLELIESYSNKIFNNRALSFEDEIIIKKLFQGNEMILDYKFLKSGNTGAKVIEIQPLKGYLPGTARFVVKFSEKGTERKIKDEKRRYDEYIGHYSVPSYSAEYDHTPTHEGIKYKYASSDGRTDSYSFSNLVDEFVIRKYQHEFSLEAIIGELFGGELFVAWKGSSHKVTTDVGELYSEYLKSESKILESISLISGTDLANVEVNPLVINYRKICDYKLTTNTKICHGDLHSENFFKDQKGVYLIDFGWTAPRHSLIDYATLECSLKFKHLPFYVPKDRLENWEKDFLCLESFQDGFDFSFIDRPIVQDIFRLIYEIRKQSLADASDQGNILEYLIALFIISFRQIQYVDLNQRYALSSANVLGEKIVELISRPLAGN